MGQGEEFEEELRVVRRKQGTHRSRSTGEPGYDRDLLRDDETRELKGPTESRAATREDIEKFYDPVTTETCETPERQAEPSAAEEWGRAIAEALIALAENPEVRALVKSAADRLWASTKGMATGLLRKRPTREAGDTHENAPIHVMTAVVAESPGSADDVRSTAVTDERTVKLTREQYSEHLRLLLMARAIAESEERILSRSRLVDTEELPAELQSSCQIALESGVSALNVEQQLQLFEYLGLGINVTEEVAKLELNPVGRPIESSSSQVDLRGSRRRTPTHGPEFR